MGNPWEARLERRIVCLSDAMRCDALQALAFEGDAASNVRSAGGRLALLELLALVTGHWSEDGFNRPVL